MLPHTLLEAVKRGELVLFLGAGASYGCTHPDGRQVPMGDKLRDLLSDSFLGGEVKDRTLEEVATFVENEAGQPQLERFVAEQFQGFQSNPGHMLLPSFRWRAIFGINYDLFVEQSYEMFKPPLQTLKVFHRDQNSIERDLDGVSDPLPYFKLHGSIDHLYEPDAPLILTSSTYVDFDKNRRRLFRRLEDLACEYPIVFIGTRLADPHIKAILSSVEKEAAGRPRYYLVSPNLTEFDISLLSKRRIEPVKLGFVDFIQELDQAVDRTERKLFAATRSTQHSIERHFRRNVPASPSLTAFLSDNVNHVVSGLPTRPVSPELFFKGDSQSWGPVEQNLDIERRLYDTVMLKTMSFENVESSIVNAILIRGVAGSGKSVFLRRIAYDLATKYDKMVLFAPPGSSLRAEPLADLYDQTGLRTILVVDQAADSTYALAGIVGRLETLGVPITIVMADTHAAFGTWPESLEDVTRFRFEIKSLTDSEILALLDKLRRHRCLGLLEGQTEEHQFEAFAKLADKQLLVALYEATQGKPLEDILLAEYHRILLQEAQELYLLVCTLNRFRVPVRAGLVRRVMGISFSDFQSRFLGPLDGMVFASMDPGSRDYAYRVRHPQIADIVFRRVLDTQSKQVHQYMRVIESMNTTYSSDSDALRRMISFRNLRDLITDLDERRQILERAEEITGGDPFVLQQQAMLEMNTRNGDLETARERLDAAQALRPRDKSIMHTRASLLAREAAQEKEPLTRKALRVRARQILKTLNQGDGSAPYVVALSAKLAVDDIEDRLNALPQDANIVAQPELVRLIEDAERALARGRAQNPDFEAIIRESYRLGQLIGGKDRGVALLQRTLAAQPHLEYVAITFARAVMAKDLEAALSAVRTALAQKPASRPLNQVLFELLVQQGDDFRDELAEPMRKAFTLEDGNILMHVHALRHHFMRGEREQFEATQKAAAKMKGSQREKMLPRLPSANPVAPDGCYVGTLRKLGAAYGFIHTGSLLTDVFLHPSGCLDEESWDELREGLPLTYRLCFNVMGPTATEARPTT